MKVQKKTLPNGMRVVVLPMQSSPTATVLVLVEAGSKYELPSESGISHFLEHMCFKGTTLRPKSIDISGELDSLGAQHNAFTSHEFTGYYAKSHSRHVHKIFDVISDLYANPTFPIEDLEKEKGVIIEEMNMYEDLPQRQVGNVFMKLLYGDQPAGKTILGDQSVIRNATRETFVSYRKKHYVPESTILVVAGPVKPNEIFSLAKKTFSKLPKSKKAKKKKVFDVQKEPAFELKPKSTDQAHIVLGVRTFGVRDKRNPTLDVLNAVLGEGMSSRLFQKIREELGVAYYVRSSADSFTDHGFLSVSMGVDKTRVKESIEAVLSLFKDLKLVPIPEKELKKAKECLIGNMAIGLESSDSVAEYAGLQEVVKGSIDTPSQYEKKIRAVTSLDIQKLAKQIFVKEKLNCAIVGTVQEEKEVRGIITL